jgi:hypothetical protein
MIHKDLHKKPAMLDRERHRQLKLREQDSTLTASAGLNSFFLTGAEFGDACKEFAIVFLRAGTDAQGQEQVAPVVVLGLSQGENLVLEGDRWGYRYAPAVLRAYPFTMARVDDKQFVMFFDESWKGLSQTEGRPLFDDAGEPSPMLKELQQFVTAIESEIERTRLFGQWLMKHKLLRDMRFDATLPDGQAISADGFLAIDEEELKKLSDADVLEAHRSGALELVHAHRISLSNMRRLVERRQARGQAAA